MTQVTSGIAEFISRIKLDGVEEGERERDRIIADARAEAERLLTEAKAAAAQVLTDADVAADKRNAQLQAELRMAARDFIFSFQDRLKKQAIQPAVAGAVGKAASDSGLMARLLGELLVAWGSGTGAVTAHIRPEDRDALQAVLGQQIAAGNLELVDEAGQGGFRLVRAGDHFTWDFSAESIARELSALVEPGLRDVLSLAGD